MEFILYFVRANYTEITSGELRKYFRAIKNVAVRQNGPLLEAVYENPMTSARYIFTYASKGFLKETADMAEPYARAQLSCRIDYLRPSYYAYEATADIARIVNRLFLQVLNQHSKKLPDAPDIFVRPEVLKDWKIENSRAIAKHIKNNGPLPYISPKYSDMLWQYMSIKDRIAHKTDGEATVPDLEVLYDTQSRIALTAIEMKECAQTVLPPCNSVVLHRVRRKGLFGIGRKEEYGLAKYNDVIGELKPFLKPLSLDKPRYTVPMLCSDDEKGVRKALLSIPLAPIPESLENTPMGGYVDILPKTFD